MKEKLLALVACGLVIAGSVYVYRERPFSPHEAVVGFGQSHQSGPQAVPKPKSTPAKSAAVKAPLPLSVTLLPKKPAITFVPIPVRLWAKPDPSRIPVNMPMSELVNNFGRPDFMASWSNRGELNRKLIYTDGVASLEVDVQNERVVSTRD